MPRNDLRTRNEKHVYWFGLEILPNGRFIFFLSTACSTFSAKIN